MKPDVKDGLKLVVLCGLTMAVIYGAAFAQQPTPAATPTPVSGPGAKIGSVSNDRSASSADVSERERILLERINQLERRLAEVESLLAITAAAAGVKAAPQTAPPSQVADASPQAIPGGGAQPGAGTEPSRLADASGPNTASPPLTSSTVTNTIPPANTATTPPKSTQTARRPPLPPYAAWDKEGVKIIPFGTLVANVNYNTSALNPGSLGFWALPDPVGIATNQFNVSPGNTYLGVDIKWPKIGDWEINGKVDFNLRGADPLAVDNFFQPQFFHVYGEARTERYAILAGQTNDIVSPLGPNTLNQYPITYIPGSLGYFRPQVRFDTYQPISDNFRFIFQGAIATPIQTFNVPGEAIGRQGGVPDAQARIALGYGDLDPNDPFRPARRPFELGVSGHFGKRRGDLLVIPIIERDFTSWSGNVDLSFTINRKLRFETEFFTGSVLGDYAAGIFQTFNPFRGAAIRAAGGWAQLRYRFNDKWEATAGYGRDDPFNRDLFFPVGTDAARSLNEMGFANVFYKITRRLWVAAEYSHWRTDWVGLRTGRASRIEPAVMFFF